MFEKKIICSPFNRILRKNLILEWWPSLSSNRVMTETFLPCNKPITYIVIIERKRFEMSVNQTAMLTLATTLKPQLKQKSSDQLTTAQETFLSSLVPSDPVVCEKKIECE